MFRYLSYIITFSSRKTLSKVKRREVKTCNFVKTFQKRGTSRSSTFQSLYKKVMTGCCEAKINVMWLVHVVRMRLSREVKTFSRLSRATRAVQISSIIRKAVRMMPFDLSTIGAAYLVKGTEACMGPHRQSRNAHVCCVLYLSECEHFRPNLTHTQKILHFA